MYGGGCATTVPTDETGWLSAATKDQQRDGGITGALGRVVAVGPDRDVLEGGYGEAVAAVLEPVAHEGRALA